jgi:nucleotide-binding universal stress UspA family protein
MIEKILFPVDFSPSSVAMAPYVQRAAELFSAQVTLAHVCDLQSHNGFELYLRPLQEIAEEHQQIARDKLESFLSSEFPPATCPRILSSGEAAAEIARIAGAVRFDLIVMPTHAGRFRRMLLGSTTAKVLDDVVCPVLTSGHAETDVPQPLGHREWVCALDLGRDSERVLRLANRAASAVGAKLSLIHVTHEGGEDEARQQLNELQYVVGSEASVRVAAGPVNEVLLDIARDRNADALIIGRKPRTGDFGKPHGLVYRLIRDSPFPVLSI